MAIGWVSLLRTVPWADVIATAPAVADGAKRLWNAVAKKNPSAASAGHDQPHPTQQGKTAHAAESAAVTELRAQIATLEKTTSELHSQMLASSELIKVMAEQNAQLIARVEAMRARLLWLSVAFAVAVVASIAAWVIR